MDADDTEFEQALRESAVAGDDDFPYYSDRHGGRAAGVPNYKNDKLIRIIGKILPRGDEEWKQVAILYKAASGESILRTVESLQANWKKLCNGFKKPTGSSGNSTDRIHLCNTIQRNIYTKSGASTLGASSAENSFDGGPGSENEDVINVDDNGDDIDDFDGTSGNVPSTLPTPVPPLGAAASTNGVSAASSAAASTPHTDGRTTTTTTGSARTNSRRGRGYDSWNLNAAAGGVGTPKTKSATNQERGSVAKSIDKLVTSLDHGQMYGGDSRGDMMAMLSMQIQQQSQNQLMQQQMFQQQFQAHMEETRKSNRSTTKLLKILISKKAKRGKKRKKRLSAAEGKENDSNRGNSSSS
ncbi:hypothetical protein ACHAXH_005446, partial [Discostella pseudostelligera]